MIKITYLSGPFAGRSREFILGLQGEIICLPPADQAMASPGQFWDLPEVDPAELFNAFVGHGWQWRVDYSQATEREKFLWFRAEFVARMVRALTRGLPVKFMGREYRAQSSAEVLEVAQRLEDDIVSSGRMITIDSDDEHGLVVGAE